MKPTEDPLFTEGIAALRELTGISEKEINDLLAQMENAGEDPECGSPRRDPQKAEPHLAAYLRNHLPNPADPEEALCVFREMAALPLTEGEDDLLLFEYGAFDPGRFSLSLTRQFRMPEEDELIQLHLELRFPADKTLAAMQDCLWSSEGDFWNKVSAAPCLAHIREAGLRPVKQRVWQSWT